MFLEFHRSERGDWLVLTALGDLDLAGAPQLRSVVVNAVAEGHRRVVLDLSPVDYLDSSGLGAVVAALKRVRSNDGELEVVCDEPRVRRVFEMCGLDRAFPIHRTVEAAVA